MARRRIEIPKKETGRRKNTASSPVYTTLSSSVADSVSLRILWRKRRDDDGTQPSPVTGNQALAPFHISDGDNFPAPAVAMSVNLAAARYAEGADNFYSVTASAMAFSALTAAKYTEGADGFHGPTVSAIVVTDASTAAVANLWTGATYTDGVTASVKLAAASTDVYLAVSTSPTLSNPTYFGPVATSDDPSTLFPTGAVAKITATGLPANTQHYYGVRIGGKLYTATTGQFKTLPVGASSFTFSAGSCGNGATNAAGTFEEIRTRNPLFFYSVGDTPYIDAPQDGSATQAAFSQAYDNYLSNSFVGKFFREVPYLYMWSDHDFGKADGDGTAVTRNISLANYRNRVPSPPLRTSTPTDSLGFSWVVGRVRFISPDLRSDRVPIATAEGSGKTMMGAAQKAWFKAETLAAKNAGQVAFWMLENAFHGAQDTNKDDWTNYITERAELADYVKSIGMAGRVAIIAGDMHALAVELDSSDYATGGGALIPVFQSSPLAQNGSVKGGPYDIGPINDTNNGGSVNQYGMFTVTDTGGSTITLGFKGYLRGNATPVIDTSVTLTLTGTPAAAFSFTPATGLSRSTLSTSNTITVSGLTGIAPIFASGSGNPAYSINGGAFQTGYSTVQNGDTVALRVTTSALYATGVTATLFIGGTSASYAATTQAAPASGDPYWANVVFLAGFEGANGATSYTEESPYARVATLSGGAAISTTSPLAGSSSLVLDGVDDFVSFPDSADWRLGGSTGTEPWTVEFDYSAPSTAYLGDGATHHLFGQYDSATANRSWGISKATNNTFTLALSTNGSTATSVMVANTSGMTANTRYRFAISSDGSTIRTYRNGVFIAKIAAPGALFDSTGPLWIGRSGTGQYAQGVFDELRITKGIGRYTTETSYAPDVFPRSA